MTLFAPYDIEHAQAEGYDIVVNKAKLAAYRAPGAPMAAYAIETVVDELAGKLGIDPIEFRLQNICPVVPGSSSQRLRSASRCSLSGGISLPCCGVRTACRSLVLFWLEQRLFRPFLRSSSGPLFGSRCGSSLCSALRR